MIKTKPDEFKRFHFALMQNAPLGYIPWYFPVNKYNKDPGGLAIAKRAPEHIKEGKGNWKAEWARLSFEEAYERLKNDLNVGISARSDDPLIIIDIDEYEMKNEMPVTLKVKSRKRCGWHGFCWKDPSCKILPINIPTDYGEIRSSDQYVVVAGSYCKTDIHDIEKEKIPSDVLEEIKKDKDIGVYTVEKEIPPINISYEKLPWFFKNQYERQKVIPKIKKNTIKPKGKHSALFDLTIENIVAIYDKKRYPHPLHPSDTGANFSVSNGLAHCWRHLVSLNPIQFLCVRSGYLSCQDAGTGHKGSGAGESMIIGDDGAIFYAWLQAKKDNLIPRDDPIPIRAMHFIAQHHMLIDKKYDILPIVVYNKVLKIVEDEY